MMIETRTKVASLVGLVVLSGALSGCGSVRAERQGKQVGDAICDAKGASKGDVQSSLDKVRREMDDLQRIVGRPVQNDVQDIQNNLSDLASHVQDGNSVLAESDIAAIERNFHAVGRTLSGKGKAAYDGVQEGLAGCDYR